MPYVDQVKMTVGVGKLNMVMSVIPVAIPGWGSYEYIVKTKVELLDGGGNRN